jgi:hypothetical protein
MNDIGDPERIPGISMHVIWSLDSSFFKTWNDACNARYLSDITEFVDGPILSVIGFKGGETRDAKCKGFIFQYTNGVTALY